MRIISAALRPWSAIALLLRFLPAQRPPHNGGGNHERSHTPQIESSSPAKAHFNGFRIFWPVIYHHAGASITRLKSPFAGEPLAVARHPLTLRRHCIWRTGIPNNKSLFGTFLPQFASAGCVNHLKGRWISAYRYEFIGTTTTAPTTYLKLPESNIIHGFDLVFSLVLMRRGNLPSLEVAGNQRRAAEKNTTTLTGMKRKLTIDRVWLLLLFLGGR